MKRTRLFKKLITEFRKSFSRNAWKRLFLSLASCELPYSCSFIPKSLFTNFHAWYGFWSLIHALCYHQQIILKNLLFWDMTIKESSFLKKYWWRISHLGKVKRETPWHVYFQELNRKIQKKLFPKTSWKSCFCLESLLSFLYLSSFMFIHAEIIVY